MLLYNGAEGGSDSTTVTTSNSGGDSGKAWGNITLGSGSLTYSSTYAYSGALSYHIQTTSATGTFMAWTSITQSGKTMYACFYLLIPSAPTVATAVFEFADSGLSSIAGIGLTTGSKLTVRDSTGATIVTSTTSMPTTQWVRLEMMAFSNASSGQMQLKIFTSPGSSTPAETLTTTAVQNTRGTDISAVVIGDYITSANFNCYYDNIYVQDTGYVGPAPYLNKFRQNNAEGQPDTTVLSRANSGISSGDPFDIVSRTGSAASTFSATQAMHGNNSYYIVTGNGDTFTAVYNDGMIQTPALAFRIYVRLSAVPSAAFTVISLRNSSQQIASVLVSGSYHPAVAESTGTTHTLTNVLGINTWYRLELQCGVGTTTSNGYLALQCYSGDSLTALDSYSTTAANIGTSAIIDARFGKFESSPVVSMYLDDIALNYGSSFPIGPASVSPPTSWFAGF